MSGVTALWLAGLVMLALWTTFHMGVECGREEKEINDDEDDDITKK